MSVLASLKAVSRRGFFHLLTSNVLIGFLGFASQLFVAKVLGPENIASIKIYQNYINIIAVVAMVGMNTAVLKLCSESDDSFIRANVLRVAFLSVLVISGIAITIFKVFLKNDIILSDSSTLDLFRKYTFVVLLINFNYLFSAYYQALQHIKKLAIIQLITKTIGIIIIIHGSGKFGVNGYMIGFVSLYLLSSFAFLLDKWKVFFQPFVKLDTVGKEFITYSSFGYLSNLTSQISILLDIIILNSFHFTRWEIGQYGFASIVISGFQLIITSEQQFFIPIYAKLGSQQKEATYYKLRKNSVFYSILLVGLGSISYFILVFSVFTEYKESLLFFLVLLISWGIRFNYCNEMMFLFSKGCIRSNFFISLTSVFINFTAQLILIRSIGVVGAALGQLCTSLIVLVLYNKAVKKCF